jgi:hypothetical protein
MLQAREPSFSQRSRAVNQVPLGRYLLFVSSLLLAMLFIAEQFWPASPFASFQTEARFDKSIIRVSSSHRWPERIILDTSLPTVVPPPRESAEASVVVTAPREAFAQLSLPAPNVSEFPSVRTRRKLVKRVPITRVAAYRPTEALPAGW